MAKEDEKEVTIQTRLNQLEIQSLLLEPNLPPETPHVDRVRAFFYTAYIAGTTSTEDFRMQFNGTRPSVLLGMLPGIFSSASTEQAFRLLKNTGFRNIVEIAFSELESQIAGDF